MIRCPGGDDTLLPVGDIGVVDALQGGPLRDQDVVSGCVVEHVLRHQRLQDAGAVAVQLGDQLGGDLIRRLQFVRRNRIGQGERQIVRRRVRPGLREEISLAFLPRAVLQRAGLSGHWLGRSSGGRCAVGLNLGVGFHAAAAIFQSGAVAVRQGLIIGRPRRLAGSHRGLGHIGRHFCGGLRCCRQRRRGRLILGDDASGGGHPIGRDLIAARRVGQDVSRSGSDALADIAAVRSRVRSVAQRKDGPDHQAGDAHNHPTREQGRLAVQRANASLWWRQAERRRRRGRGDGAAHCATSVTENGPSGSRPEPGLSWYRRAPSAASTDTRSMTSSPRLAAA